jgi:hypothetical protein
MKKTLTALSAAAIVAGTLAVSATDASAQRRHHHHHHGGGLPGLALGLFAGALVTGAILASRPRGYVVYESYDRPVHHRGCYWAAEPVYNRRGQVVGYGGDPVQVCEY